MAIKNRYYNNYKRIYSDIEISPKVISVLKKSDRKMKHMEIELKRGVFIQNQERKIAVFRPSREDSYDRIME